MNKINEIIKMGFKITWRVIVIGLLGESYILPQLSRDDVFEYLDNLLIVETVETDKIITLISERDDLIKSNELIACFARIEDSDLELQLRKWRAFLLQRILDNVKDDFMQGLLALTEFWVSVGMPSDGPHEFPNRHNVSTGYFTKETFVRLRNKNERWLMTEIQIINSLEYVN